MENFIKELTIIDFLGILVPGSLVLLLFSQDYPIRNIWCGFFGSSSAADTIIFLVAGYLTGMLIHELGDLLEKIIWACPYLNPRYHAAKNVYFAQKNIYNVISPSHVTNTHEMHLENQDRTIALQFIISNIAVCVILISVFFFPFLLKYSCSKDVLLVLLILLTLPVMFIKEMLVRSKSNQLSAVLKYVKQNPAIQVKIFGKASAAKRQIFDGFYCIMRNLLLVIGSANIYALCFTDSPHFSQQVKNFYDNNSLLAIYFIASILMLIRCCHYAYLKYKYSYEDYLYLLRTEEQNSSR